MKNLLTIVCHCKFSLILWMLAGLSPVSAATNYYFYVQLSDKKNSPYSLSQPSAYLSERAIARRTAFGLSCDSTDLPVNPSYVQQIEQLGLRVHCHSKWMNGITVVLPDSSRMSQVRALPFVRFTEYTGIQTDGSQVKQRKTPLLKNYNYGLASAQISQLSGQYLHNRGFRGKDIHIGVLDAGFANVNSNPCFDSLRIQGKMLGTKDIINPNSNIYAEDSHGAMVLSTMGGNLPGQFLGTAPEASYWLIRTEYAPTEYKVETDFWCSGIEFADSAGVDIVNSSLGYYTFDDSSMDFSYADMNGKVARSSRAAAMAARKGIIVVASAGNEGNSTWHYIGSPADADGIIAVGAVTADSTSSYFSSFGPSADNRVKPEVCAIGTSSAVVNTSGYVSYANGTSFASPIMAGMMACYLQAVRQTGQTLNVKTILQSVFEVADSYKAPTIQQGYGIPNFELATRNLGYFSGLQQPTVNEDFGCSYDATNKAICVWPHDRSQTGQRLLCLYSITGKLLVQTPLTDSVTKTDVSHLPGGIYAICIIGNGKTQTRKVQIY